MQVGERSLIGIGGYELAIHESTHFFPYCKTSKEHGMCKCCNKTAVHKLSKSKKSTITNKGC